MDAIQINQEDLDRKLEMMGPYARKISEVMLALGQAVELVLNARDRLVLDEMELVVVR